MKAEIVDQGRKTRLSDVEYAHHVTILKAMARVPHHDGRDVHIFVSEACQHGDHERCGKPAGRCSVCNMVCLCGCHEVGLQSETPA